MRVEKSGGSGLADDIRVGKAGKGELVDMGVNREGMRLGLWRLGSCEVGALERRKWEKL